MGKIRTHRVNPTDIVVTTSDGKRDFGIISKVNGSHCFYPLSTGCYITVKELQDVLELLNVFNKKDAAVPILLKKELAPS